MSGLDYYSYEGGGVWFRDFYNFNSALRLDDKIEISGQGGWIYDETIVDEGVPPFTFHDELREEIEQSFVNIQTTLEDAGGKGLSQVYRLTSYHVNMTAETLELMVEFIGDLLPHKPLWTVVGVDKLALDPMRVEIDVFAYDPEEKTGC